MLDIKATEDADFNLTVAVNVAVASAVAVADLLSSPSILQLCASFVSIAGVLTFRISILCMLP